MAETLAPINPAVHNAPEYSVSEISGAVKRMVEDRFGRVRVRGEISAWKLHSSGHAYFRLKDAGAVLDAVCWRGSVGKIPFKPEDGLEVVAVGRVTTYPGKSSYQIVVESMEPAGAGALMAMLEKRKAMLAAEGLFAPERKRLLPFMPQTIGVITSPTGAVIRDILHRISERFPTRVLVWPVAVQGEGAAAQVAAAIEGFALVTPRPDVLIVARGGGSVEDLWAFNEEVVVRAAANSPIPLISAVGHETDTTLTDFAADKRAPTPTAAAEMATAVREELRAGVSLSALRLQSGVNRLLGERREMLSHLSRGLPAPARLFETAAQALDSWAERLHGGLPQLLQSRAQKLAVLMAALKPQLLAKEADLLESRLNPFSKRADAAMEKLLERHAAQLAHRASLLDALDYRQALKRGFALVLANGAPVTSAARAAGEPELSLTFHDGTVAVTPS